MQGSNIPAFAEHFLSGCPLAVVYKGCGAMRGLNAMFPQQGVLQQHAGLGRVIPEWQQHVSGIPCRVYLCLSFPLCWRKSTRGGREGPEVT